MYSHIDTEDGGMECVRPGTEQASQVVTPRAPGGAVIGCSLRVWVGEGRAVKGQEPEVGQLLFGGGHRRC